MKSPFSILSLDDALRQTDIEWLSVDIVVTGGKAIPDEMNIPSHILIVDTLDEQTERQLLRYPGKNFIAQIGHGDVNLWGPMLDYKELPEEMVQERIERGIKSGKDLNIIGHLLVGDRFTEQQNFITLEWLIVHLKTVARRDGFSPNYDIEEGNGDQTLSLTEDVASLLANEIVANWSKHSSGDEKIELKRRDNKFFVIISNTTNNSLQNQGLTSLIRRPFIRWGRADTTGLGYFIISLISSYGAIEWTTDYEEGRFLLTLSFS
ncbi:hypothetical protein KAH37_01505 [bacterium]|nr:hypothetical protein [bacterium]